MTLCENCRTPIPQGTRCTDCGGQLPWVNRGQTFAEWCVEGMQDLRATREERIRKFMSQRNPLYDALKRKGKI
jgi:hypothetical protein